MKNESDADERERTLLLLQTQLNWVTPRVMYNSKGYKPIELVKTTEEVVVNDFYSDKTLKALQLMEQEKSLLN